jgi:hypothetical protein
VDRGHHKPPQQPLFSHLHPIFNGEERALPNLMRMLQTRVLIVALLAGPGFVVAQNQTAPAPALQQQPASPSHGWRRADDPPAVPAPTGTTANNTAPEDPGAPPPAGSPPPAFQQSEPRDQYGNPIHGGQPPANNQMRAGRPPQGPPPPQSQYGPQPQNAPPPQGPPPAELTIKPGTYLTVRINQPLSSDHNQPGDAFSATLVRPLVVDGFVVAQTGETLGGRVEEAQKAGRVQGVSRLAVQLTDLTLVDGQNIPIHSQLISRSGPTSVGRDVAAVGGTTALGAAVGATADWGRGAAIGAGAGAAVGLLGVLLTRGHPTVLYPEQVLTFRVEAPITIATDRAPQAFRWVEPEDYNQGLQASRPMTPRPPPSLYGGYPYYYGPGIYPYWGPSVGFFYGPRFYGRGYYYRGWRR